MKKRYKIRKEQLERVVESFVTENTKKKESLDENLINEGMLGDFVEAVKSAAKALKPKIASMAKKDPEIMATLKSAASTTGEDEFDESLVESFLAENKGLITEGWIKNAIGKLMQGLGLAGLSLSVPAFMSQITGWSEMGWTTKLHEFLEPFCSTLPPKMCGPLTVLAIGFAIFMLVKGAVVRRNA